MCWGRLYRKDIIGDTRFKPEIKLGDDTLFNLQVVTRLNKPNVYETSIPLYYYLQRKGSIVRKSTYKDLVGLPDWIEKNYESNDENEWSWMPLLQAIKFSLSYRYESSLQKNCDEQTRANKHLGNLIMRLLKNPYMSTKGKVTHLIMTVSPQIYRCFRLRSDPSLREWEKIVRRRTKENKRKKQ